MLKKILKLITNRLFIVGLMLLIQIIAIFIMITKFENFAVLFYFIFELISILLLLKIINSSTNPSYKIAWLIPILTIPIFGTLFYLLLGNKDSKRIHKRMNKINERIHLNLKQDNEVLNKLKDLDALNQANYLINQGFPIYNNTKVEYLKIGQEYYEKLIIELNKAQKYIFLEYFIIEQGKMWNSILDILIKKVNEGVDVRIIYDDMGTITTLPNNYAKLLNKYGVKACSFNKFVPIISAKLNNRDHRKMVIIDGIVGFTGGINLADEYINEKTKYGYWLDNGVMIKGKAVYNFTVIFLSTWEYIKKEKSDYKKFKVDTEYQENGFVLPYDDNPLDDEVVGKTVYLNLINKAKKYIYITTPYLIIDNELETALKIAAKSGIDVRIITPGIADKKLVNEVTKANYPKLLEYGVKIYEYVPGFIHEKMFIIDDIYATIGTINLDYRSLYLHFECGIFMYKTSCIKEMKKDYENTLSKSKQILKEDTKIGLFKSLKRSILRLFAPLM